MSNEAFPHGRGDREVIFPTNTSYIPDDLKQRAEKELLENNDTRVKCLKLFKSIIENKTEFEYPDGDLFLLSFLRTKKFDIKKAVRLLKTCYTVICRHDELFYNFNFDLVKKTLQQMKIGFLPYRDCEGCVILLYKITPWDTHENSLGDIMRAITCLLLIAIRSPATQISGIKLVLDYAGFSITHIRHISACYIRLGIEALNGSFPGRFRGVHVVNESILFSFVWAIVRPVLSRKIRGRWHFHGKNVMELHKFFSPSILPAEYKGELPEFENSSSLKEAEENVEYLKYIMSFVCKK